MIAATYAGILGVPAIFDRTCFKRLLSLSDEKGAKALLMLGLTMSQRSIFRKAPSISTRLRIGNDSRVTGNESPNRQRNSTGIFQNLALFGECKRRLVEM